MADHRSLAPFILRWEGGFVNDPYDLGGATNKGITLGTYKMYCKRKGYPRPTVERLKNLSDSEWMEIFKTMYWDRWRADDLRVQRVANILVDWVWASGVYGIKIPQKTLGLTPDGVVGPKTLTAVNDKGGSFVSELIRLRLDFVEQICRARPENNRFKRGWIRRIKAL